jgi:hypothetical protein
MGLIASADYDNSGSTTAVVGKPTGTVEDDLMLAFIRRIESGVTPTGVPSDWTLREIEDDSFFSLTYYLYYKVAGGSEPSDYTWTWAGSVRTGATIATYRGGFNIADPINVSSNTAYDVVNTILRAASMVASAANSTLIFLGGVTFNATRTFTKPSVPTTDWVEDYDGGSVDSRFWRTICSMVWTGSGATGNMDATISAAHQDKHAFAVALNPAAAAGGIEVLRRRIEGC